MPYSLQWEHRGVYRQYFGNMTLVERRESFDAICADQRFDDLRYVITDYLRVQGYQTTPDATAEIAALHIGPLRTNPRLVMCAVVDRPDLVQAVREFKTYQFTTQPYEIFATLDAARQWIKEKVGKR